MQSCYIYQSFLLKWKQINNKQKKLGKKQTNDIKTWKTTNKRAKTKYKNIHIKCDYLKKRKNLFKNDFFKESLKKIPKGVRSTKMSSCNLT